MTRMSRHVTHDSSGLGGGGLYVYVYVSEDCGRRTCDRAAAVGGADDQRHTSHTRRRAPGPVLHGPPPKQQQQRTGTGRDKTHAPAPSGGHHETADVTGAPCEKQ